MGKGQIKSKERVAEHGEVFTNEREVKAMCDLVGDECVRIDSRFLEPACGDGNFLAEILNRKLEVVTKKYKRSVYDYEKNALLAIGSLYGVELLMDNVLLCRKRLFDIWDDFYIKAIKKKDRSEDVRKSVIYILEHNIICGDALSLHCVDENAQDNGKPIVFSQWAFVTGAMMKREDYTFEQLLNGENEHHYQPKEKFEQQISFGEMLLKEKADQKEDEGTLIKEYPPIHYRRLECYG